MFSIRTIDTFEYISVLRELVESGHEVCVKVSGYSMYPFLRSGRDTAFFRKPDRKLRVGDIVFYQRLSGQYILHRICEIDDSALYMLGDSQRQVEGPILPEQVFAVVTHVERDGKEIWPDDKLWSFYAGPWRHLISVRPWLIKLYTVLHRDNSYYNK